MAKLDKIIKQEEDLKLILKIRSGDRDSLDRLVGRYLPQLIGFFRYLRAPEAIIEDLVQETFEKVIRKLDSYNEEKSFSAWIMTIGRNHYFDERRKENRKKEKQQEAVVDRSISPEEEVIVKQSASELLKSLKPQEKFLVEMRIFQNVPFAELAEMTGEHEGTLRSRFFRLMGRLRISTIKRGCPISPIK